MGAFLTRVFTVMLATVMAVSLGMFANDALNMLDATQQSAYAATGTTPYTNIDVPLSGNGDNQNDSDDASPDRVEAGDEARHGNVQEAGILGPTLSSAPSRISGDVGSSDGDTHTDTYIEGPYTYKRIKDESGEDKGKLRLVRVDPSVGKVARIEANVSEIASGAFAECGDLQTLIVFGNVKSIAKAEYDVNNNLAQEGAFTDEQLKNTHVVFATTYLDETSLHETHHAGSTLDEWDDAESDKADGEGGMAADTEVSDDGADPSTTPVDEGIKRLSGDVMLSAPIIKNGNDNIWLQSGFESIVDTPQIGAKGTALPSSKSDDKGGNSDDQDGAKADLDDNQSHENADQENANSESIDGTNAENAFASDRGKSIIDLANPNESDNEILSQLGISVGSSTSTTDASLDGFTYTLLPDYTLEVVWNGDDDMPVDLVLPNYGQVDGTIHAVRQDIENLNIREASRSLYNATSRSTYDDFNPQEKYYIYIEKSRATLTSGRHVTTIVCSCEEQTRFAIDENDEYYIVTVFRDPDKNSYMGQTIDWRPFVGYKRPYSNVSSDGGLFVGANTYSLGMSPGSEYTASRSWVLAYAFDYTGGDSNILSYNSQYPPHYGVVTDVSPTVTYENTQGGWNWCIEIRSPEKWGPLQTVLTLDPNGGVVEPNTIACKKGNPYGELPTPTRQGYAFQGWYTEAAGGTRVTSETICTATEDHTLYAHWTANQYTVTLDGNGGTPTKTSITATYDVNYPDLGAASRTGYAFAGWYTSASGGNQVTTNTKCTTAGNHTLYAHWTPNKYTVSFNANGGSGGQSADVTATYDAAMPAISTTKPTRTGYTFGGWYDTSASTGGTQYYTAACASARKWDKTSNMTLYARWTANAYTVTYSKNKPSNASHDVAGTTASSSHTYDTNKALTSNGYSLTGWRFNGWNTAVNGSGTSYSNGASVKNLTSANGATVTLYAQWVANAYTVTYSSNKPSGASGSVTGSTANSSHTYDTAKALTANGYSLTGWRFNGWNTAANGTGTSYGNGASVKNLTSTNGGTVTLYAQWAANTYTVAYNSNKPGNASNNVAGTTASSSHTYDTAKALTANGYSLTGWTFKGWNTAANGTGASYANGASVKNLTSTPNGTVTLYAQWTANTYYVSYNANFTKGKYPNSTLLYGGTPSSTSMPLSTHTYDTAKALSANLYGITGYDFDGWNTAANGFGTSYADRQGVKTLTSVNGATVILYAKWRLHTYTIDVNALGGKMPAATPNSYTINSSTIYLGSPTRPGYDFYGWSVTGAGEHGRQPILNTDPAQIATGTYGNLLFTASWGEIEYRVQYNPNGGVGNAIGAQTATYGKPFTVATGTGVISRDGYEFSGYWNTFPDGSGNSYKEGTSAMNLTMLSGDTVVLYAVWNANRYALTLDAAGGTLPDAANWTPNADRSQSTKQVAFDSQIGTLLVPTRAGYEFAGWYNDLGENVTSTTVYSQASPMTLYARWTPHVYDVYFYKGAVGATGSMEPLQFYYGTEKPLTPNSFEYAGHTFLGWSRTQGATTPAYRDGEAVSNLTTDQNGVVFLYAVWSENHYSLNLYSNGAEVAEGFDEPCRIEDIAYTRRFYLPHANDVGYSMTGYRFAGWSEDRDAETGRYQSTDEVSAITSDDGVAVTLWAIWTPISYRLTLDATGGRFDSTLFQTVGQIWSPETNYVAAYRQIRYDEEYLSTIEPKQSGFDFAGWYTHPQEDPYVAGSGEGVSVSASDRFKNLEDTTLYAHWTPHTYTLNLVYYNSESMTDTILLGQTLYFNEPFTLPTAGYRFEDPNFPSYGHTLKDYQRTGFAVSGWSITRDGETNYQLGQTISGLDSIGDPDRPYTLYLTQAAGRYTVEFDPGVASGIVVDNLMLPQTWLYTDYVDVPYCSMSRAGYEFSYWTTNVDSRTYTPGYGMKFHQMVDIGETLVLTAHWKAKEITLRFMGTHKESVADMTITYDTQISSVPTAESDRKCVFEGWWTKRNGSLDQCYFDWNGNINQGIDAIFPYWRDAGNENGVVELWARWTFEVSFEFPYGGEDPSIHPSNYSAGQTYGDPSNEMNFNPSYGLPVPKYNGFDSNKDADGNVRRFAGWYDAPVGGNLVTDDTLATGPVRPRPGADYEDVVLYARWYVDVTLDYPTYAPYTEGWAFEYGGDLTHTENGRGQTVVSYVQGIPYAGDRSFVLGLPRAERAGYSYLGWNTNERKVIDDGDPTVFDGEIQSRDTVTAERNYTIYLEYARQKVDVTVRYWQQVIEGVDEDGTPSTGAAPSIYSDDVYTSNGHYKLVEADTRTEHILSETQLAGDDWHEDPATGDGRYRGFTYHATQIAKDANAEGEAYADALLVWDGMTTPEQAKADLYDGCVASDGTSVIDVFYTRNKYDVTLHDFEVIDGAGETQVRGSAHARADSSNDLAYSPTEASGIPGRVQVLSAWFEEEVTAVGRSWAGYDFSGWDIEPTDLGYSKDVVNEDPNVRLEGDVYTFTVTDSDLDVTPRCTARTDTEYHATLHYQSLINATSVEDDRDVWPTSAQIRLTGTTDALTDWTVRADAADMNDANVIEEKVVGTSDFNVTGFPADVAFDGTYVFDPHGFTGDAVENTVIRADGDEAIHVYYARDSYLMDVLGYEAAHGDGTPVGDEGCIEAYLWDNLAGAPAEASERAGVDTWQDANRTSYAIYFHAPIGVVAVPHAGTELLGYTSSNADIWNTKALAEYANDIDITLDANPLVDSAGLANASPGNPYTFKHEGENAPRPMPIVPGNEDGTEGVLTLTIEGQPARTSYEVVVLGQDTGDETTPAGIYSQIGDATTFTDVTEDGQARLVRYWQDGTYVSTNSDDPVYVPVIEGFGLSSAYTPALFGYEAFDGHGIVDLTELTPEGNASFHGTSSAPSNKAYVYMDRNGRSLGYEYAIDGRYADSVSLNDDVMSTLPPSIGAYFGADVTVAGDPSANGWEFLGWTWAGDPDTGRDDFPYVGEGTDSETVTIPDFDVEIVGTWAPIEYALDFDGGTAYDESPAAGIPEDMAIPFGSEWTIPADEPERAGYTFVGWTFAERAVFEAIVSGPIDLAAGDVDGYRTALAAMSDLDGNPLILEPGQSQVWSWHKGDRTLHAVWMRNSYDITFELGDGGWPTGTSVPLTYMTGAEVKVPQPASEGYAFTGWEITCGGSQLDGDAPAVSYTDGDPTRAVINEWAYGDIAFTARYDVKRFAVSLNPAGGTFDGEPEGFMDRDIEYSSPDGEAPYGQATVYIPFNTEINASTPLPEPERPGYDFAGWTDAEGDPVGWTLGDDGNRVDAPYTFDGAKGATWVASWRAHRYKVTYDLGEHSDAATINGIDAFSEYFAGMTDASGNVVTSFMLPTADDIEGLPEGVGFDGWYPAGGNPDSDRMRSFDPNATTGDKEFVAAFSTGANVYTERFWLEVLDQAEDDPDKEYAFIGDTKFMLDETLSVTRRTDSPNAQASMSAITGFASVNPYDGNGVSIYPTEHPYVCVFSAGQNTVNGFYTRETHELTVGTANGVDDDETLIQVSPASALVKNADMEGSYTVDDSSNTATLKGQGRATVKWGAAVNVGVACPRETGYSFTAWQTDAGATPADIDVRANPAAFTMPDADVVLDPTTELIRFSATYKDIFGKDVAGAGQETFTVLDSFALANLDDIAGYRFLGWEAYVADADGNKLDPAANPVPATVGYDEDQEYMRVREGTAADLLFEARYEAVEYTVSVTLPKGTAYLPSGMPDGLPQVDGVEWELMHGADGTDAIGFTYTIEDLTDSLVVDLSGINCAPYRVDGWTVAGANGEASMPELSGGVLTLTNSNLGDWNLTPDVSPIRYTLTLDLSDVRDGYVPLDVDAVKAELEAAGYEVRDGDKPETLDVTFDVETADPYTLPTFGKEDDGSTPEHAFRGWAKDGDGASASNPYILPPADIATWPETGTVIAPVWAKAGEQSALIAHLPNEKGECTDDYTFTFTGDALTPIDYSQDGRFADIVNDVDDKNVGYHLVWHGTSSLTDDDVTTLPANFPESGTQEVWGEWVEDDDIITVGFGVKWDNSAPPGETKPRSAFALNPADVADGAAAVADGAAAVAAYPGDGAGTASTFPMRSAYSDDAAAIDETTDDAGGDATEAPVADANSTYYYIPNKGLYTKDINGKYHVVTRIADIDGIAGTYAGWRLEGFYLPIDTEKPERIIIGPDGTVDNATFVEVAGAKPSDLTFTVRWARISLVEVNMVGGYGDDSEDITFLYWPEKDVFVKADDEAIGDVHSAPKGRSKDEFNGQVMLFGFASAGMPPSKEDADGTCAFIGYFGQTPGGRWDCAEDAEGNALPTVSEKALAPGLPAIPAITDDYGKQAIVGTGTVTLPYGYDAAQAYDPASADGTTKVTWRAAWEGDLDAVYFNATVPMSMSFMVRPDGTAIGPEAGAYQIRNYSNTAISVEDMSFEWADESELEALFGKGATDALTLSATPTAGQEGYAQTRVLLERSKATQDAVGAGLISRYVFGADKWVIAKSVGIDPDDFTGDASILPALRLDYGLTAGGIRQLTQENESQDTTHPIGTLKFTLKTVR